MSTTRKVAEQIVRETILVVPGKIADRYIDAIDQALYAIIKIAQMIREGKPRE